MADVERRAEAEAAAKGLSGQARKSYIGGVFNRIRQAHAKATTPGARGRRMFNRRERVQARLDARLAMQPHREAIDVLRRQRNERIAAHQDEPRETTQASVDQAIKSAIERHRNGSGFARIRDVRREVAHRTGLSPEEVDRRIVDLRNRGDKDEGDIGLHFEPNEDIMHQPDAKRRPLKFGGHDFDFVTLATTPSQQRRQDAERAARMERERREMFAAHGLPLPEEKRAKLPSAPKPPKREPAERQRQHAIADAIKHGAPDFPPGTLAAAEGKTRGKVLSVEEAANVPLTPRPEATGGRVRDPASPVDPYYLQHLYGDAQLHVALSRYTAPRLMEAVKAVQARHPGTKPAGGGRAELIAYIEQHVKGKPAATPPPPAAPAAMARPAEKVVREKPRSALQGYLSEPMTVGGERLTRGEFIQREQAKGVPQANIDRYLQGYELGQRIRARRTREAERNRKPVGEMSQDEITRDVLPLNAAGDDLSPAGQARRAALWAEIERRDAQNPSKAPRNVREARRMANFRRRH